VYPFGRPQVLSGEMVLLGTELGVVLDVSEVLLDVEDDEEMPQFPKPL
jgi:hypothetical protein